MERKDINSTRIKSAGWKDGILEIEFKNNSIALFEVSESKYQNFISASDIDAALKDIELQGKFYIK